MGSTSYMGKSKTGGYRAKSGSSIGSDKDMNGKLRRPKIRRPTKLNDYGLKRIPDYTELAYKEAVSKLRYFLPGNYAPLARSYVGSPSIKNLDESDADLDKKYSYSLAEYKPRPRLTAKYTTLYADSLNNTYPSQHHVTNTTAPTAATASHDLAGGTNPDVINFIQKQEEYIEQLERESQYCRDELNNLLGKVKEVISENENLHEAQKNKMISRMFHSYQGGSETDELDDFADSTGLDSDNKVSPSKARRTKSRSSRLEGPNIVFESRIAELEAQLTQSKIDLKKVQEENNENKRKLASGLVDSTCLDGFKRQIDNLQRDKSSLESQISKLKMTLEQKDEDGKYRRGSDVVEQQLREERNTLEAELRRLKDELASERGRVRELAGEGARRAVAERSAAEQRYTAHFDELQRDLAAQYDNVAKLQLDLERQRREENDLKRELSMKNSAIEELKMELKNKTASLQADLTQAHAEKGSLEEELASARLAIERHQRQAKHESNRLNSEIQSLRQRLDRADADVVHSRRENLRLSDQIATLEKELNMRSLTPISPEKKKDKEKELSNMFESMENKHAKTVAELESMIQSQNSLMEKLTDECRLLTDKLDDANRRHKNELATLQRQVEVIGRSMHQDTTPSTYQAHATHETPTSRVGHEPLSDARPDHSRDDPTRYTTPGRTEPEGYGASRPFSRRESKQSLKEPIDALKDMPNTETDNTEKYQEYKPDYSTENYEANDQKYQDPERDIVDTEYDNSHVNIPENRTDVAQFEPSNDDVQIDNRHDNLQYEQNADNVQYDQGAEYQNQAYEQPYDASTGQYENYEQYPQQYTDPNTQYGEQYNYNVDGNYQEPNYDNTQYQQDYADNYQEQAPETQPATQTLPPTNESKRSNSPNEKPANRS